MKADWDTIDEPGDYSPIPDGEYLAKVTDIEEKSSSKGDPMWSLTLEVQAGQFKGRRIFDNITWSPEGMKRVKLVLSRLGLELKGEMEVNPGDIEGRSAWVSVTTEEFFSDKRNRKENRNKIGFAGYRRAEGGQATASVAESSEVPF